MARPRKDAHREDSDKRILDAAEAAFGDVGFARARLADIASAAGMRRPSLLHHFASKAALYEATLRRALRDLITCVATDASALDASALDVSGATDSLLPRLEAITAGMLAFAGERPATPSLILAELVSPTEVGEAVLAADLVPFLDTLEALARAAAKRDLPEDYPLRDGILTLFTGHLVRLATAGGPLRLWSGNDTTLTLMRALLRGGAQQEESS